MRAVSSGLPNVSTNLEMTRQEVDAFFLETVPVSHQPVVAFLREHFKSHFYPHTKRTVDDRIVLR